MKRGPCRDRREGQRGRLFRFAPAIVLCALFSGCQSPTPYQRPALEIPSAWKLEAPWRESAPNDAVARGPWWLQFNDPQLTRLQEQALEANPTLSLAAARLAQARANVNAASAGLFPQAAVTAREQRLRISANRPLTNYAVPNQTTVQSDYAFTFAVAYEADLWGRVKGSIDASKASAEQAGADLENFRLIVATDLAANYFNLRQIDIELKVVNSAIELQRRALDLVSARHELGVASGLERAQQQAQLDATLTQVDLLRRQRYQFENAIATLIGKPAPVFSLPADSGAAIDAARTAPALPLGLPSDLLERRPDVASAERAVAAANAQIGIARSAYYPSISLGGALGADSRALGSLLDAPSLLWSFGVSLAQTLFDGGRIGANVEFAKSGYEATVANYRRVVLTAMQEVEDGVLGSTTLDSALAQANKAVASAQKVLELANVRYQGGVATYLEVITAQQALLASQRQAAQLVGQRLLVSVFLIKALGGSWQVASR